jgi:hypothetical protein
MAFQNNRPFPKAGGKFEHKPGSGSIFKNPDYNPQGDPEDSNNYSGNITINVNGKIWKGRLYPKAPQGKTAYTRVSLYDPEAVQQGGNQPQQQPPQQQFQQQAAAPQDDDLPF